MDTTTTTTAVAPGAAERVRVGESDGMAVASFVLGLIGLLLFNLVLGPLALVLGGLSLARGTGRRGRALLGMALGAADLVVLAVALIGGHGAIWQVS
ncbi:DUF4190 domain-containing protein [Kitasatospora viridis]|uniref:DUF4190 domain-containing protein n=1 Tax=Kitasatospora viridis TaxID=281105 RepID=A0A561TTX4_9ACTN|nr:DUF4190 domain-containing protein [Kitasatospora viridis]TWF90560.1 hypothetical protein FHX73_13607 [Kitasatospora viridis]